jgi:DNA mismatch endonuclease (patch repair protein)
MADCFSKSHRSYVMSRIRSSGNLRTEIRMIQLLRSSRIKGWRRHYPVFGNPDFVFPKERLAIFVDGCFWHGCARCKRVPKTNSEFWKAKIRKNRARDRFNRAKLRDSGWTVVEIWQHSLSRPHHTLGKLNKLLGSG